jgi:hypothetical protein
MKAPTIAKKRMQATPAASRAGIRIGLAMCARSPWYGAGATHDVVNTTVFADHLRARWLEESSQ